MFRKVIICLILCVAIVATATCAYAKVIDNPEAGINSLYYNNIITNISVSGDGEATAYGLISGVPGVTTKLKIELYLQKYSNGSWSSIGSWTKYEASDEIFLERSKIIDSGYRYRTKAVYTAYHGTASETVIRYSREVTY